MKRLRILLIILSTISTTSCAVKPSKNYWLVGYDTVGIQYIVSQKSTKEYTMGDYVKIETEKGVVKIKLSDVRIQTNTFR